MTQAKIRTQIGGIPREYALPRDPGAVFIIGRGKDANLQFESAPEYNYISNRHCHIRYVGDGYVIIDGSVDGKPSSAGTFVNGQQIFAEGKTLSANDEIKLGNLPQSIKLQFVIEDDFAQISDYMIATNISATKPPTSEQPTVPPTPFSTLPPTSVSTPPSQPPQDPFSNTPITNVSNPSNPPAYPSNLYGQKPPSPPNQPFNQPPQPNPYGQPPNPYTPPQPSNPYGQKPPSPPNQPFNQPPQPNPYGQPPNPYTPPQSSNPYGQKPPSPSNQPFNQPPQPNPYGQPTNPYTSPQSSNPYGQPTNNPYMPPQSAYGQAPTPFGQPPNPYSGQSQMSYGQSPSPFGQPPMGYGYGQPFGTIGQAQPPNRSSSVGFIIAVISGAIIFGVYHLIMYELLRSPSNTDANVLVLFTSGLYVLAFFILGIVLTQVVKPLSVKTMVVISVLVGVVAIGMGLLVTSTRANQATTYFLLLWIRRIGIGICIGLGLSQLNRIGNHGDKRLSMIMVVIVTALWTLFDWLLSVDLVSTLIATTNMFSFRRDFENIWISVAIDQLMQLRNTSDQLIYILIGSGLGAVSSALLFLALSTSKESLQKRQQMMTPPPQYPPYNNPFPPYR